MERSAKINSFLVLVGFILIAQTAGIIGSFFNIISIEFWYPTLIKPFFSPPNWLFAPVWVTLYLLMGIASYLVYKNRTDKRKANRALKVYFFQLFLNTIWSGLFFGLKNPGLAFVEIVLLWGAIVYTIYLFAKINKKAAYLLVPYILWVSFAAVLNFSIWYLNYL